MNARSALFDLYGDHLRSRGGRAPIAALVRLLAALDVAAPAVRTAVSRLARQHWLEPVRVNGTAGYALTSRAVQRLDAAAVRIYRTGAVEWDGEWHVVVLSRVSDRGGRERLRKNLRYLGYAPIGESTWLAARPSPELAGLLRGEGVSAETFTARHEGDSGVLAGRAWDLDAIGAAYHDWLVEAEQLVEKLPDDPTDEQAFALRSHLVHEWRKFLFTDPGLPRELLPEPWPGDEAAAFFDEATRRLLPAANRFVDDCLATNSTENGDTR